MGSEIAGTGSYETPDRASTSTAKRGNGAKSMLEGHNADSHDTLNLGKASTVTPPDSAAREAKVTPIVAGRESEKESQLTERQVRFVSGKVGGGGDKPENATGNSARGVVSRRGGRFSSPARSSTIIPPASARETILELKAFRSPSRKKEEIESVPSLCSAGSVGEKARAGATRERSDDGLSPPNAQTKTSEKPLSISCDSSRSSETSPLKSEGADDGQVSEKPLSEVANLTLPSSPREAEEKSLPKESTTFQNLPKLDDSSVKSPMGLFLSSQPPTPSQKHRSHSGPRGSSVEDLKPEALPLARKQAVEKSPKSKTADRERYVTTPTDFTTDYGKAPDTAGSFGNSNVLAWLQSPTANGLFSPGGGFSSVMNTPRVGAHGPGGPPRTPRTPTVSTSFFFSDVAGLPRSNDVSPKPGFDPSRRGSSQRGYASIICISPLASSKAKGVGQRMGNTPTNFKDVFASPADRTQQLPVLGDSPASNRTRAVTRSSSRDPSLEAVHMAERDLMEDEDLSVLLQLASNTPRQTGDRPHAVSMSEGTHVLKSPASRVKSGNSSDGLPGLQLPIIGGNSGEGNSTRLTRKTNSRNSADGDQQHSDQSIDVRLETSLSESRGHHQKGLLKKEQDTSASSDSHLSAASKGPSRASHQQYSMPPPMYVPRNGSDQPTYYPPHAPPGIPHGGSLRVVVGGPPPSRPPKSSSTPPRAFSVGPADYSHHPYPPPGHYHHHHGLASHIHAPPHYAHYPPPPAHHRPPPSHRMSLYGVPPLAPGGLKSGNKTSGKQSKGAKAGQKRPLPTTTKPSSGSVPKKKKVPTSGGKKKNKSPPITDKGERDRAAATIKAVNQASGGKNDKAAALAAAILRGVTMRPSGKWQAQLYFAGKSRYIGVFDSREKAALAYEIAREKLKSEKLAADGAMTPKATENAVNAARKAAFDGVNEKQK